MAGERQKNGYLYGAGVKEYARLDHYRRAIDSKDIQDEEYWAQSVFHGPSHARNLRLEIFQKKRRNSVSNRVDTDTVLLTTDGALSSQVKSSEAVANIGYSRVSEDSRLTSETGIAPDAKVGLAIIMNQISSLCSDDELKVFAYFIVQVGVDKIIMDEDGAKISTRLKESIKSIWDGGVTNINMLNAHIGTKYRCESARRSIKVVLSENFPDLLVIHHI